MAPLLSPECKLELYQLIGINWLAMLSRLKFGKDNVNGILGDEMGLGKTVQTIAFLAWYREYGTVASEDVNSNKAVAAKKRTIVESESENDDEEHDWDTREDVMDEEAVPSPSMANAPSPATPGFARKKGYIPPHLVIVPASVLDNWMNEFAKFSPNQIVVKYHGDMKRREEIQHELRSCLPTVPLAQRKPLDIIITTYSYFESERADDRNFLRKLKFSYLVLDEAHCLKNPNGKRYSNINNFNTDHRLLLTGTPIQNSPKELMSLLCFLMRGLFKRPRGGKQYDDDDKKDDGGARMLSHFVRDMKKNNNLDSDENAYRKLKHLMAPFILRRKKNKVLAHIIPPKTTELVLVKFDASNQNIYTDVLSRHAKTLAGKMSSTKRGQLQKNVFVELRKASNNALLLRNRWTDEETMKKLADIFFRAGYFGTDASCRIDMVYDEIEKWSDFELHQACLSLIDDFPSLEKKLMKYTLMEEDLFTSPKMIKLRTMIPELIAKGHRILVFSQWVMTVDLLVALMRSLDVKHFRLDGSTAIVERQSMIDEFNSNPDIPVFLITTRAGGMGINLTAADTVILHDLDFNPTMDEQAQDRCHRIGQKKPVTVYKLVTANTVDQSIYEIQERKTSVNSAITEDLDGNSKEEKKRQDNEISKLVADALHQFLDDPNASSKPANGQGFTAQASSPAAKPASSVKKLSTKLPRNVPEELLGSDTEDDDEVAARGGGIATNTMLPPGSPNRRLMSPSRKPSVDKVVELLDDDTDDEKDDSVVADDTSQVSGREGEGVLMTEEPTKDAEKGSNCGAGESEHEVDSGDEVSEFDEEEKKRGIASGKQSRSADTPLDLSGFDASDSE